MSDSVDEDDVPDARSLLYRVIEGLTVVALIGAVVVWQSDGTLTAARRILSSIGQEDPPAPPPAPLLMTANRSSDIRLVVPGDVLPTKAQSRASLPGSDTEDVDPVETGSIPAPLDRSAPVAKASTGSPAPAARTAAQPSGWILSCDARTPASCTASQSLARPDNPSLETSWTIESGEGGLVGVWTTPTSVVVSRGMVLTLGDGKPKTVPFDSCGPHSCEVRARLAADFIEQLKGSARISTEIVLRGGKTIVFSFSKTGLGDALKKLGA